jgi:hypothetical protein
VARSLDARRLVVPVSYAAHSPEGRILLALRAGETESAAINERIPIFSTYVGSLTRLRLVEKVGESYRLTEAGRAACPWRNPEAAPNAAKHEENKMPQGKTAIHREQVLAAIVAAGPQGITRRQLIDHFKAGESAVDMHVLQLNRQQPPVIFKPRLGLLVAIEHQGAEPAAHGAALPPVDIHGVSLDVDHHEATDLSAADLAKQMAQIDFTPGDTERILPGGELAIPSKETLTKFAAIVPPLPLADDIDITDPDTVEFAIFSSGGLDIYSEDGSVSLAAPVLKKLRAFLGLFQEAA